MPVEIIAAPPPLAANQVLLFFVQLCALLVLAILLGRLAGRFGLPAVAGELLTGVILGPSLLGWVLPGVSARFLPAAPEQAHLIEAVGLISVVLLVGVTGAHLDLSSLGRRRGLVASTSIGGLVVPLALGIGAGFLVPTTLLSPGGDRVTFALFLGVAMCVSAIPVIAKILMDMKLIHRDLGQVTLSVAAVDDTVGWLLLSVVSAMAVAGLSAAKVALSVLYLVLFLAIAFLAGRPLVRAVIRRAGRSPDSGASVAATAAIILICAMTSHAIGLEPVFGAFVAGLLIGSSGVAKPAQLAPLRTVTLAVLAPLFLASAGLRIDLTALADPTVAVAAVVILALAILGKFVGAYIGARVGRVGHWEALVLGAGLNARGVVEVVIATVGLRLGVLSTATYTIILLVAVLTSVMAPPLLRWAMRHVAQNEREDQREVHLAAWTSRPADVPVSS